MSIVHKQFYLSSFLAYVQLFFWWGLTFGRQISLVILNEFHHMKQLVFHDKNSKVI